jgi:hypothetical protein
LDDQVLAALFEIGDGQTKELVRLLYDPNRDISLRAQILLRYLGNDTGIRRLNRWLGRQTRVVEAGPIPIPLRGRDYEVITSDYIEADPRKWRGAETYIVALAIDGSPRARMILSQLAKLGRDLPDSTKTGAILRLARDSRLPSLRIQFTQGESLRNAFFVASEDRRYASAKFIGFSQKRDKAILEICINRGALAEEWYHVVVKTSERNWRYLSITQVGAS